MNIYVKGLGVLVGTFDEYELKKGIDREKIEEKKKETGLNYVNTKIVKENNIRKLKVWVCNANDFKI